MTEIIYHYTVESLTARGFDKEYTLDDNTRAILDFLDKQIVVAAEPVESPTLRKNDKSFDRTPRGGRGRRGGGGSRNSSKDDLTTMMDDWDAVRNFKATEKKEVVGFEKELNNIRGLLNKLSAKNYDTQKTVIVEKVNEIVANEESPENPIKVANMIFDIASANRFLSDIYADIYVELVGEQDIFGNLLDGLINKYRTTMNSISYVDPNENYDKFCDYNKENELRRASAAFIMNLTKREMISRVETLAVIEEIQSFTLKLIDEDNRKNDVEEITENMFILITMGRDFLAGEAAWKDKIVPFMQEFVKRKAKDHTSLSSRCIFKYMDMIGK